MKSRLEVAAVGILSEFSRRYFQIAWKPQHEFHPERKWRCDFLVWIAGDPGWDSPEQAVLVEIEGTLRSGKTRHQTAEGYEEDARKYNAAILMGWKVLRYTRKMLIEGEMDRDLLEFFGADQ